MNEKSPTFRADRLGRSPLARDGRACDDRDVVDRVEAPLALDHRAARESHWDAIYEDAQPDELGWYEPLPSTLALVTAHSDAPDGVIDVGGGASRLSAELLARGYRDLTVLDLSETALVRARHVLGPSACRVAWIHADVTRFEPARRWHLWHDRAVYHFLTDPHDQAAYHHAAASAVAPGGSLVLAAFALDGPDRCAGLPVRRFDQLGLAAEFADEFEFVDGASLRAMAADGDQRPYTAVVLRRRS